jgi:TonB family protein
MSRWTPRMPARCFVAAVFLIAATSAVAAVPPAASPADDTLAAARDLYASAAYEDALAVLNRLRAPDGRPDEGRAIDQYRAFCLLALGRNVEAERAIEAVVAAEPMYHPSDADVSPRVRSAFSDVRRRMLPNIIQQKYAVAKAAYDRRDFAAATDGFSQVLKAMTDPDVVAAANQPPLSDLRTLATGFNELAVKASAPLPSAPPLPAPTPVEAPPPPRSVVPQIYAAEDSRVAPPVTINQTLPLYPTRPVPTGQGVLEVIIDESGTVESAAIRSSVNPLYDRLALAATKTWRYRPATVNGVAVKFRKSILITLSPKN